MRSPYFVHRIELKENIYKHFELTLRQPFKTLFTWSGGPRSSGVGFFCFVSPRA